MHFFYSLNMNQLHFPLFGNLSLSSIFLSNVFPHTLFIHIGPKHMGLYVLSIFTHLVFYVLPIFIHYWISFAHFYANFTVYSSAFSKIEFNFRLFSYKILYNVVDCVFAFGSQAIEYKSYIFKWANPGLFFLISVVLPQILQLKVNPTKPWQGPSA